MIGVRLPDLSRRGFAATDRAGFSRIYFVRSGDAGPVKIGVASDVIRRLQTLQTGNPDELHYLVCAEVPEGIAASVERRLHDVFRRQRIRGEWFAASAPLLELADGIAHGADLVEELERIEGFWS